MYIAMCLHEFKGFKEGSLCEAYTEDENVMFRANGTEDKLLGVAEDDFWDSFVSIDSYIVLPIYEELQSFKNTIRKIAGKDLEKSITERFYGLDYDKRTKQEIYSKMLLHLLQVKDKEILAQFGAMIKYSLDTLDNMYKMRKDFKIDMQAEIERVGILFKSIGDNAKQIEHNVRAELEPKNTLMMNEFLKSHHSLMDSNIEMLKLLNS